MTRALAFAVGLFAATSGRVDAQFVSGDLYVSDGIALIYRIEPGTWKLSLFADSGDGLSNPSAINFTSHGTLLCSSLGTDTVVEIDSNSNSSVLYDHSDGLGGPYGSNGLVYDASGNLYVSDQLLSTVFEFPAGGGAPIVIADASDGVVSPDGLAFAANGDLLIANRGSYQILRVDPSGNVSVFDTLPHDPNTILVRQNGDVYVACPVGTVVVYRYASGDPARRSQFATMTKNAGIPAMQWNLDQSTIYLTSWLTGNLVTLDPDNAKWKEVLPRGTISGGAAIGVYPLRPPASWSNFGAGFSGTNGVPAFTSSANPVLGTTITLHLDNSYGNPTSGLVFYGLQQTDLPTSWGGDLLVAPLLTIPISFSYGADSFDWSIPDAPGLVGLTIELQSIEADPGASKGVSFTPRLELLPGY